MKTTVREKATVKTRHSFVGFVEGLGRGRRDSLFEVH